jgi:hypothetical protein
MAYRRTYSELEAPTDQEFNYEKYTDSELYEVADLVIGEEPVPEGLEEIYSDVKGMYDPLVTNMKFRKRAPHLFPTQLLNIDYGHLGILFRFSQGISASGISKEFCPNAEGAMVRYLGPPDAKQAEEFLTKNGFKFWIESGG